MSVQPEVSWVVFGGGIVTTAVGLAVLVAALPISKSDKVSRRMVKIGAITTIGGLGMFFTGWFCL
jgi:hypothetical protein